MSSAKNLSFNCAVITGGGGGIGKAIAKYFISLGKKVIIVGRTESNLKETAQSLGHSTSYYVLDAGNVPAIEPFVQKVIKEHPEVDCIVNNAGVQRPLKIKDFDLASADQEIDINIRGPMHLTIGFLKHLQSKQNGGVVINVSSVLGFLPSSIITPNYNATKAWVHFWSMSLRTQLKDTSIRVLEVVPPSVGTDLHRDREDPDDNKKHKNPIALSLEEFMDDFRKGIERDDVTIGAGPALGIIEKWYGTFGDAYAKAEDKYDNLQADK